MSLYTHIDLISALDGVAAVAIDSPGHPRAWRGPDQWVLPVDAALRFHDTLDLEETRSVAGDFVIVVVRQGDEVAAVLAPVGHDVMKSLHRALRRLSKPTSALRTRRPRRSASGRPSSEDVPQAA